MLTWRVSAVVWVGFDRVAGLYRPPPWCAVLGQSRAGSDRRIVALEVRWSDSDFDHRNGWINKLVVLSRVRPVGAISSWANDMTARAPLRLFSATNGIH
jgi:hypothetical protein